MQAVHVMAVRSDLMVAVAPAPGGRLLFPILQVAETNSSLRKILRLGKYQQQQLVPQMNALQEMQVLHQPAQCHLP